MSAWRVLFFRSAGSVSEYLFPIARIINSWFQSNDRCLLVVRFPHLLSILVPKNFKWNGSCKIRKDIFAQPQQLHNILRALADGIAMEIYHSKIVWDTITCVSLCRRKRLNFFGATVHHLDRNLPICLLLIFCTLLQVIFLGEKIGLSL